jgi:hypothetical protein
MCAAALMLFGCGMPTPVAGPPAQSFASATKNQDLLYVATGANVYVLSYPGGKFVQALNIAGNNLCADKNGDVFVPTVGYEIVEYSHAGTPIQTLADGDIPLGCSVDPTTGNLAVTNEGSGAGEVAIFPNAQAPAQWYRDPEIYAYGPCGYDDRGNLFLDGMGTGDVFAELPKSSSTFANYPLGKKFDAFGSVQWDGEHITLTNPTRHEIYRLKLAKSSLRVVGTTHIDHWQNAYAEHWPYVQTWLQRDVFLAQSSARAEIGIWHYPAGGSAEKILGPFESGTVNIYGIALSVAPRRGSR